MAKAPLNGASVQQLSLQALAKHGPWAFFATILLIAFYYFALQPMKAREDMLYCTLQENVTFNRDAMKAVKENTAKVTESVEKISDAMEERVRQAEETQEVMFEFAEEMHRTHPEQEKILSDILSVLKKNGGT